MAVAEQAIRHNEGKVKLSYAIEFMDAMEQLSRKMEAGAEKYERNNWRKGLPITELADSLLRHLTDFMDGKNVDAEDGTHPRAGVLTNTAFMLYTLKHHPEMDDRHCNPVEPTGQVW